MRATTINDVIGATGLSKGAFYHHYRSKEDLLEAIAQRFADRPGLRYFTTDLRADRGLRRTAAAQLACWRWGATGSWSTSANSRAMFTVLLRPANAVLYHRIVEAVFAVLAPALAQIIEDGKAEGAFDTGDARTAADTLLWLSNGRRPLILAAMATADTDVEAAISLIVTRVRAEEAIVDRILGLARRHSVQLLGPEDAHPRNAAGALARLRKAGQFKRRTDRCAGERSVRRSPQWGPFLVLAGSQGPPLIVGSGLYGQASNVK